MIFQSRARWEIVPADTTAKCLVIRDVGPWDKHPTITNDAEAVVADLFQAGSLRDGVRLMYYDSIGNLDELQIVNGRFVEFLPGPLRGARKDNLGD